jgi:hypothetical protein
LVSKFQALGESALHQTPIEVLSPSATHEAAWMTSEGRQRAFAT